jgi:hypothetical protein
MANFVERVIKVTCAEDQLIVNLADGRSMSVAPCPASQLLPFCQSGCLSMRYTFIAADYGLDDTSLNICRG